VFIGHYSACFLAKGVNRKIPLWQLFLAVQFIDIIWATFILMGIEKVRIVPGITAASPLDLYFMPYTHSLIAVIGWAVLVGVIYRQFGSVKTNAAAFLIALVVFSHWAQDLLVHRPDLAIIGEDHKVGFGIWHYPILTLILELGLLWASLAWYATSFTALTTKQRAVLIGIGLIFSLIQVANQYGPVPENDKILASSALAAFIFFAIFIGWLERKFLSL
jgi:hypothetical protein